MRKCEKDRRMQKQLDVLRRSITAAAAAAATENRQPQEPGAKASLAVNATTRKRAAGSRQHCLGSRPRGGGSPGGVDFLAAVPMPPRRATTVPAERTAAEGSAAEKLAGRSTPSKQLRITVPAVAVEAGASGSRAGGESVEPLSTPDTEGDMSEGLGSLDTLEPCPCSLENDEVAQFHGVGGFSFMESVAPLGTGVERAAGSAGHSKGTASPHPLALPQAQEGVQACPVAPQHADRNDTVPE